MKLWVVWIVSLEMIIGFVEVALYDLPATINLLKRYYHYQTEDQNPSKVYGSWGPVGGVVNVGNRELLIKKIRI